MESVLENGMGGGDKVLGPVSLSPLTGSGAVGCCVVGVLIGEERGEIGRPTAAASDSPAPERVLSQEKVDDPTKEAEAP